MRKVLICIQHEQQIPVLQSNPANGHNSKATFIRHEHCLLLAARIGSMRFILAPLNNNYTKIRSPESLCDN